jgi:hypothetical protein
MGKKNSRERHTTMVSVGPNYRSNVCTASVKHTMPLAVREGYTFRMFENEEQRRILGFNGDKVLGKWGSSVEIRKWGLTGRK